MNELIAGLLAIWLMGFGLAVLIRQHRRYVSFSRRQAARPFRAFWRANSQRVIWAAIGAAALYYFLYGAH